MSKERLYPTWSQEEDNIVIEAVRISKENDDTLKNAFLNASSKLDRTLGSISFRWNNKLKHEYFKTPPTEIPLEDILTYLKHLDEKNKEYLSLENKYNKLLSEYNSLVNKFNNISKIIS